jgi:hypothetical protein
MIFILWVLVHGAKVRKHFAFYIIISHGIELPFPKTSVVL